MTAVVSHERRGQVPRRGYALFGRGDGIEFLVEVSGLADGAQGSIEVMLTLREVVLR